MLPPPPLAVNWFRRPLLLLLLQLRAVLDLRPGAAICVRSTCPFPAFPTMYLPLSTWTQGSDAASGASAI